MLKTTTTVGLEFFFHSGLEVELKVNDFKLTNVSFEAEISKDGSLLEGYILNNNILEREKNGVVNVRHPVPNLSRLYYRDYFVRGEFYEMIPRSKNTPLSLLIMPGVFFGNAKKNYVDPTSLRFQLNWILFETYPFDELPPLGSPITVCFKTQGLPVYFFVKEFVWTKLSEIIVDETSIRYDSDKRRIVFQIPLTDDFKDFLYEMFAPIYNINPENLDQRITLTNEGNFIPVVVVDAIKEMVHSVFQLADIYIDMNKPLTHFNLPLLSAEEIKVQNMILKLKQYEKIALFRRTPQQLKEQHEILVFLSNFYE